MLRELTLHVWPVLYQEGLDAIDRRDLVQHVAELHDDRRLFLFLALGLLLLCLERPVDHNSSDQVQEKERRHEDEEKEAYDKLQTRIEERPHVVRPTFESHDLKESKHAEGDRLELGTELPDCFTVNAV